MYYLFIYLFLKYALVYEQKNINRNELMLKSSEKFEISTAFGCVYSHFLEWYNLFSLDLNNFLFNCLLVEKKISSHQPINGLRQWKLILFIAGDKAKCIWNPNFLGTIYIIFWPR